MKAALKKENSTVWALLASLMATWPMELIETINCMVKAFFFFPMEMSMLASLSMGRGKAMGIIIILEEQGFRVCGKMEMSMGKPYKFHQEER